MTRQGQPCTASDSSPSVGQRSRRQTTQGRAHQVGDAQDALAAPPVVERPAKGPTMLMAAAARRTPSRLRADVASFGVEEDDEQQGRRNSPSPVCPPGATPSSLAQVRQRQQLAQVWSAGHHDKARSRQLSTCPGAGALRPGGAPRATLAQRLGTAADLHVDPLLHRGHERAPGLREAVVEAPRGPQSCGALAHLVGAKNTDGRAPRACRPGCCPGA
jgi:hypothetical protein